MLFETLSNIKHAPGDPIFGVQKRYDASPLKEKYTLSVGVYRTEEGLPYVFPAVREAEARIHHRYSKDYLPMVGCPYFINGARDLLFTSEILAKHGDRIASCQSLAGTGALYMVARFAHKHLKPAKVLLSDPMWPNYRLIFGENGNEVMLYPWIKNGLLDLDGFLHTLDEAPKGSLVVLQVCAHNPTGVDPSHEQWKKIYQCVKDNQHIICFDFAYMGFASGDIDEDARPVREFIDWNIPFFVCFSFSKCMGLYGERIGCCHYVGSNPTEAENVRSQFAQIGRQTWSVCPQNGSYIAAEILHDKELRSKWIQELKEISGRIISIRSKLCDLLEEKTGRSWEFLRKQKGMFAYSGLTPQQVEKLEKEGVFIPSSGRISVPAINNSNVEFIAQAIANVIAE